MLETVVTGKVNGYTVSLSVESAGVGDAVALVITHTYREFITCQDNILFEQGIDRRITSRHDGKAVEIFGRIDKIPAISILRKRA